ncbi:hypothetical protein GIB67_009205 [Kingdonia uniflora]|uniref:Uncharacterized protein n=1 Tax=Kingdonia uniflora TaxID=39325 RepID=A0A7J7N324_9MAGN|nr:hypothetical protein GIB67_009205 [Kingdonia uniflora]
MYLLVQHFSSFMFGKYKSYLHGSKRIGQIPRGLVNIRNLSHCLRASLTFHRLPAMSRT